MIVTRRLQSNFADGLIAEEISDLREPWMQHADQVLRDDALLTIVQEALSKRIRKSKTRGRPGTPAEVVLRMLLLKHIRDWSFADLTREVRANLVYRDFTRIGGGTVPDDKTMGRLGRQLGAAAIDQIHQRLVWMAQQKQVIQGRKLRVDTTVVETNIHYPTDSSLLGDGVRVLTRVMKKVSQVAGEAGAQLRDRTRSIKRRILEIARVSRDQSEKGKQRLKTAYRKLLDASSRVVGQAKKFSEEIAGKVKRGNRNVLRVAKGQLDQMIPRMKQVMRQTRQRVFGGDTRVEGKIVSVFEPQTEVIRKGKAGKPTEFGKMVKIQEAENQIVTQYEVFDQRPSDSDLLIPSLEKHIAQFGSAPKLVAADAGFFSAANEAKAEELGVKRVAIPSHSTKSPARKQRQKARWFKKAQKWRTGVEGRISVLKRRHGVDRSLYKGTDGARRWVGLGVMADNLINIGRFLVKPMPAVNR
ncbi:MAG: ISNCY family transposase [Candidatus Rokuibacteriota bacterium]